MAFAITNLSQEYSTDFDGLPISANAATGGPNDASGSQADLALISGTTNSTIFNMGSPLKTFKAYVYIKSWATAGTTNIILQVSSSATFASDVRDLDSRYVNVSPGTANTAEFMLSGITALSSGAQYVRVSFVLATTTGTADLIVYGA